jgi:hypothetical protein
MSDKELADRIVALGVGRYYENTTDLGLPSGWWYFHEGTYQRSAASFVRDWLVAGTLMERCHQFEIRIFGFKIKVGDSWVDNPEHPADLPRAICEACVAALENTTLIRLENTTPVRVENKDE